jgi:hypothetical protein
LHLPIDPLVHHKYHYVPSFVLLLFFSFACACAMHMLNLLRDGLPGFVGRSNVECFVVLRRPLLTCTLLFCALFLSFPFLEARVEVELLLVFLY